VKKLDGYTPSDGKTHFNMACVLGIAAGIAPPEQQAGYQSRALQHLTKAADLGYKDLLQYTTDPDLAPLRKTPDYQAIIKRLKPQ
jgi:hypothetical protein